MDAASNMESMKSVKFVINPPMHPSLARYKVYVSTGGSYAVLPRGQLMHEDLEKTSERCLYFWRLPIAQDSSNYFITCPTFLSLNRQNARYHGTHSSYFREKKISVLNQRGCEIIARRAEGGMRDALSILDQALSLTQRDGTNTAISEEITGAVVYQHLMTM